MTTNIKSSSIEEGDKIGGERKVVRFAADVQDLIGGAADLIDNRIEFARIPEPAK